MQKLIIQVQIAAANNVIMAAEKLGKYKAACQDVAIFVLIFAGGLLEVNATLALYVTWVGLALFAVATVLTILSGISYVVKNKQVLKDN